MLTARQICALFGLRRRMVRSRRTRAGLTLAGLAVPVVLALAVWTGVRHDGDPDPDWMVPALFASVALVAVIAPLAVGGGYQMFPEDHLVAYPVRPATAAFGSLLLSPLNLTWLAQVAGVAAATGYLAGPGPRLALAVLTAAAYVVLVCIAGAALAWALVGARARRGGRVGIRVLAAALAGAAWVVAATGNGRPALHALPSRWAITLVKEAYTGSAAQWATGFAVLVLGAVVAAGAAVRACGWALTRVLDRSAGSAAGEPIRRRAPQASVFRELVAIDRASVWRAPALRRGILLLGTVPGATAAVAGLPWPSVVMLPGIVAAGTGLLFGINVFCLDAGGAAWLATLPQDPRTAYLAKARVLAETCLLTSMSTVLLAACRTPGVPNAAELAAVATAVVLGPILVVATCMSISVRRPHRAELRGPRDTPAPPGSMFVDTVLLSVSASFAGAVLAAGAYATDRPWLAPALGAAVAVPAVCSVLRGAHRWREPGRRARVVATVAAG
ncbi:MAG TPA: hypothetical protein VMZ00_17905 [Sporichthya sp.]|nr:hypothetical protein [Sporichthya sp.]